MAFTSAKMGLRIWNLLTDLYDHTQLADNWAKLDYHDHSPGKGVQIPTEGIADGAVTGTKLASSIDPTGAYSTYRPIKFGIATIGSGVAANTFALSEWALAQTIFTTAPGSVWYFDPADFVTAGRSNKLRLACSVLVGSATPPAINYTFNIYPVTAIASNVLTASAAVTGSSAVIATPAGNSMNRVYSADFDPPAAGYYIMTVTSSGAGASGVTCRAHLQAHQV